MQTDIQTPGISTITMDSMETAQTKTTSLPPELVGLIVRYLDRKDLVKVLTLGWTWAYLAAAQLWETIHLTANSNKVIFLITKSVPPPKDEDGGQDTGLGSGSEERPLQALDEEPPRTTRRGSGGSYPWPTLLPYHSMVQSLHVSLSSADMVQDLNDILCCCTELRSFTIHSAIPTEDLLIRGVISMANRDGLDPMDESNSPRRMRKRSNSAARQLETNWALHGSHVLRQGDQEAMAASLASQSGLIFGLLANHCRKLEHIQVSGFHPVAVLGSATDLRPLPPKFDLGRYHDPLFPISRSSCSSATSLSSTNAQPTTPLSYSMPGSPRSSRVFPYTPAPSVASSSSLAPPLIQSINTTSTTNMPPLPTAEAQAHSRVRSLHFVNCTVPPQYLLNMLQYALPELTELSLTQSWRDAPVGGSFLTLLARACPRLRSVSLHATQNHQGAVDSAQLLQFLKDLEDSPPSWPSPSVASPAEGSKDGGGDGDGGSVGSGSRTTGVFHPAGSATLQQEIEAMAEVPLGSFRGGVGRTASSSSSSSSSRVTSTTTHHYPHVPRSSREFGVQVTLGTGVPLNASVSSSPWMGGGVSVRVVSEEEEEKGRPGNSGISPDLDGQENAKRPSALEKLRVWFTHSVLNEAIVEELANKRRHPQLRLVEFGSEDYFDVGEQMLGILKQERPEIQVSWVCYGDTGGDRED